MGKLEVGAIFLGEGKLRILLQRGIGEGRDLVATTENYLERYGIPPFKPGAASHLEKPIIEKKYSKRKELIAGEGKVFKLHELRTNPKLQKLASEEPRLAQLLKWLYAPESIDYYRNHRDRKKYSVEINFLESLHKEDNLGSVSSEAKDENIRSAISVQGIETKVSGHDIEEPSQLSESTPSAPEEYDETFLEGRPQLKTHLVRERNQKLADRLKAEYTQESKELRCEVCKLSFEEYYGEIGAGYIEMHHNVPIKDAGEGREVKPDRKEFAFVCANCHRMMHRPKDRPPLTIKDLKDLIGKARDNRNGDAISLA